MSDDLDIPNFLRRTPMRAMPALWSGCVDCKTGSAESMPGQELPVENEGECVMAKTIEAEVIEPNTQASAIIPASTNAITPMGMLERAVTSGASIEVLSKLMDLQDRWDKNNARKAFDEALAAAKAEIPPIFKNRQVGFESRKPGAARTDYRHEDLAEIARTIDPILSKHGLSYRWRTQTAAGEPVTVTCIISHRLGHSEENTLVAPRDDSGNKNAIQAIGSAVTYLQRYTLKAALGLAASNDDDGKTNSAVITDQQAEEIQKLIMSTKSNIAKFCDYFKIASLPDLPASQFKNAIDALNAKVKQ